MPICNRSSCKKIAAICGQMDPEAMRRCTVARPILRTRVLRLPSPGSAGPGTPTDGEPTPRVHGTYRLTVILPTDEYHASPTLPAKCSSHRPRKRDGPGLKHVC